MTIYSIPLQSPPCACYQYHGSMFTMILPSLWILMIGKAILIWQMVAHLQKSSNGQPTNHEMLLCSDLRDTKQHIKNHTQLNHNSIMWLLNLAGQFYLHCICQQAEPAGCIVWQAGSIRHMQPHISEQAITRIKIEKRLKLELPWPTTSTHKPHQNNMHPEVT